MADVNTQVQEHNQRRAAARNGRAYSSCKPTSFPGLWAILPEVKPTGIYINCILYINLSVIYFYSLFYFDCS